jgi:hypothetical protein
MDFGLGITLIGLLCGLNKLLLMSFGNALLTVMLLKLFTFI